MTDRHNALRVAWHTTENDLKYLLGINGVKRVCVCLHVSMYMGVCMCGKCACVVHVLYMCARDFTCVCASVCTCASVHVGT